ncbi:MAG TPA: hypothetical protein VFI46_13365 [Jiangellaceae bacterium]|nr:hypothetical protein [Jiangellaceae bacterium]
MTKPHEYEGVHVVGDLVIDGVTARGVQLLGCTTSPVELGRRIQIRRSHFTRLSARNCVFGWAVLEDVTVDGFPHDTNSAFFNSCEFHRVILKGNVGTLQIQMDAPGGWHHKYVEHLKQVDATAPDWGLDISEAEGQIAIKGYAARRIRRDPSRQAVVTFEQALAGRWRDVDLEDTLFEIGLEDLLTYGWQDIVLSANPRHKRYPAQLRAIAELRDAGAALPD